MDARAYALDDDRLLAELGWVRAFAGRLLADPNDADDVVQETWLRTRAARVRFESRGRLRAWLAAVVRRMARDTLRARRRRARREELAALQEARADAGDVVARSVLLESLLQAVRALDEPQRSTVLLRYLDGYRTAEIAAAMAVPEELVRKRLARARTHLRTVLEARMEAHARAESRAAPRTALRLGSLAGALLLLLLGLYALAREPAAPLAPADGALSLRTDSLHTAEREPPQRAPPQPAVDTRARAPLSLPEPELAATEAPAVHAERLLPAGAAPATLEPAPEFLPIVRTTLVED